MKMLIAVGLMVAELTVWGNFVEGTAFMPYYYFLVCFPLTFICIGLVTSQE